MSEQSKSEYRLDSVLGGGELFIELSELCETKTIKISTSNTWDWTEIWIDHEKSLNLIQNLIKLHNELGGSKIEFRVD